MKRILVIEDDAQLRLGLKDNLEVEGYHVLTAVDGESGVRAVTTEHPDVVVLDVLLPAMNGFDVCRAIRARGITTPVLMLTARGHETDKVLGLELGADDYLTKPFSFNELLARVRALVRRGAGERPPVLSSGNLTLDPAAHTVRRGDERIDLTAKEFALLEYFMRHSGEVLSRTSLIEHVWDFAFEGDSNVVDVYVRYLREKIDRPFGRSSLETVRGAGYRLRHEDGDAPPA
jgi:two-component system OmpR family response regulator